MGTKHKYKWQSNESLYMNKEANYNALDKGVYYTDS